MAEEKKKKKPAPKKDETKTQSGNQNQRRQMDEYGNPLSMADYRKQKKAKK